MTFPANWESNGARFGEISVKRLSRIGLFLIVLLGGGGSQYVHAQPGAAAETLTGAGLFAFGGIGFAGATSDGEKAFRAVMTLPHDAALETMESVFAKGGPVAKSYALAGIHVLAPKRFDELYRTLEHSQEKVQRMEGCIGFTETMQEVARKIRSGAYDGDVKPVKKS
jgi:hypothetical protein